MRDWLFVEDHCAGIELVLREGAPGEIYNVGGGDEHENIEVAERILGAHGRRPLAPAQRRRPAGHDRRYSLDTAKLRALGWAPQTLVRGRPRARRSSGIATTATGGSRSSPASTASTTRGSTPSGSPTPPPYRRKRPSTAKKPCYRGSRSAGGSVELKCCVARLSFSLAAVALSAGFAAAARGASVCSGTCFSAPAGSGALFVFSGHGWGHGVGMSQYGAYGYALHGASFQQILAHYYPGTTLGPARVTKFRVLLADRKKKVTHLLRGSLHGRRRRAARGSLFPPARSRSAPSLALAGKPLTAPLTFLPGKGGPLTLAARVPRADPGRRRRRQAPRGQHRPARAVPLRRRSIRDALDLVGAGARAQAVAVTLLRARDPEGRRALRRVLGHAQPDVSRDLRRVVGGDRSRERDQGTGALVRAARSRRRTSRRPPAARRSRASTGRAPRSRTWSPSRSVRQHLAVPQLGPGAGHGADDRKALKVPGRSPTRRRR